MRPADGHVRRRRRGQGEAARGCVILCVQRQCVAGDAQGLVAVREGTGPPDRVADGPERGHASQRRPEQGGGVAAGAGKRGDGRGDRGQAGSHGGHRGARSEPAGCTGDVA